MKRLIFLFLLLPGLTGYAQKSLQAGWASKNVQYEQEVVPTLDTKREAVVTAWRGERVGLQFVLTSETPTTVSLRTNGLKSKSGKIEAEAAKASFLSYVITDNFKACGYHPSDLTPYTVPDMLSTETYHQVGKVAPAWLTVEVPRDARPGLYSSYVEAVDSLTGRVAARLAYKIRVLDRTLPVPAEQRFHSDFWQQPYAVSRYHDTERWSDEHFELLRPYLRLLARSGQKVCSAILFYEPWGEQSHDKFDPMVKTVRKADGSWSYDYTVFDRWVNLCNECGITGSINCFSMVPWDMTFRYYDEAAGKEVDLKTTTSSLEYKELWSNFLKAFAAHLKEKGWYEKTCIAMDERGLENMLDAYRVAQEAVPGIKMALAGTYHKELVDKLQDYCIAYGEDFSEEEFKARREKGRISTTYTCCSTPAPNLFSNSLPAEASYLPLYCIANGFDGYLHWSWMNWADNPKEDSRFRLFAPGDTYLIYPGPASSVRYERYIEGISLAEKVLILREQYTHEGRKNELRQLEKTLAGFTAETPERPCSEMIEEMERLVNR